MELGSYYIYLLLDPTDNSVRYVGMSDNPYRRYAEHITFSEGKTEKSAWIKGLQDRELLPKLSIIERGLSREEVFQHEQYWIWFYTQHGEPLLNIAKLGVVGHPDTPLPKVLRPERVHIRERRIRKQLSQHALGKLVQVSGTIISRIEYAGYVPPTDVIERLAKVFNTTVEEIVS